MSSRPADEMRMTELRDLADKAGRARRLAADMTDPSVRRSLLEWALHSEARMTEIRSEDTPVPASPERD